MQNLFKAGLVSLLIQAIAFVGSWVMIDLDTAFSLAMFVSFGHSLLLLFSNTKQDLNQVVAADVAASYAFGIMCMHAVYHLQEGGAGGAFMWAILAIGLLLTGLRVAYVGVMLSTKATPPEKFMNGFLGALPLGIGIIASFAIMWDRAGKPKE